MYFLNSANYVLYANSQSFSCLNLGCTTTFNTPWIYSYQYSSSDTYYLVLQCQNILFSFINPQIPRYSPLGPFKFIGTCMFINFPIQSQIYSSLCY